LEFLLGGPAGDYKTGEVLYKPDEPIAFGYRAHIEGWFGDEAAVFVYFDGEEKVSSKMFVPADRSLSSLLARIRGWLHL
jgi:hypothetical protein